MTENVDYVEHLNNIGENMHYYSVYLQSTLLNYDQCCHILYEEGDNNINFIPFHLFRELSTTTLMAGMTKNRI